MIETTITGILYNLRDTLHMQVLLECCYI